MKRDHSKHGKIHISFPLPDSAAIDLNPDQDITINGVQTTVRQAGDRFEISEEVFLRLLLNLGTKLDSKNMPERIEDILEYVPEEYRQEFWDGVRGGH